MELDCSACMLSSTEESKLENDTVESLQDVADIIMSPCEADLIIRLHNLLGNRWPLIAGRIPGRTAAEIERYCNWKWKVGIETQAESSSKMKIVKPVSRRLQHEPSMEVNSPPWRCTKNSCVDYNLVAKH